MSLVWLRGWWGCGMSVRAVIPGDASDAVASHPIAGHELRSITGSPPLGTAGLGALWIFVGFDAGFFVVSAFGGCWFGGLVDICRLRCGLFRRVRLWGLLVWGPCGYLSASMRAFSSCPPLGVAGLGALWIFVGFDAGFFVVSAFGGCWFGGLVDICRLRCGLFRRVRLWGLLVWGPCGYLSASMRASTSCPPLGAACLGASWIFVGFDAGFYLVSASWGCLFRGLVAGCRG